MHGSETCDSVCLAYTLNILKLVAQRFCWRDGDSPSIGRERGDYKAGMAALPDACVRTSELLAHFLRVVSIVFDDDLLQLGRLGPLWDCDGSTRQHHETGDFAYLQALPDELRRDKASCSRNNELHSEYGL